jgi:hypothetical protein
MESERDILRPAYYVDFLKTVYPASFFVYLKEVAGDPYLLFISWYRL